MSDSINLNDLAKGDSKYMDHHMEGNRAFHSRAGAEGVVYAFPMPYRQWKRKMEREQQAEARKRAKKK